MSSIASASFVMEMDLESISGESASVASSGVISADNSVSTATSRLTVKQQQAGDDENLATKESKDLIKLRFFLITILFWMTVGCGLTIWAYFTVSFRFVFLRRAVFNRRSKKHFLLCVKIN
jgi:hypothetical protein